MKTMIRLLTLLTIAALIFPAQLAAQEKGNKNVIRKSFDVEDFTKIKAGGAFDVFIEMGDRNSLEIETDENIMETVVVKVDDGELSFSIGKFKKPTKLNAYITAMSLNKLQASGASDVKSKGIIKADMFEVIASGASDVELELEVNTLRTDVSGASTVVMSGTAVNHSIDASGASDLKAAGLETRNTNADVSGASTARVNVKDELTGDVSGAGDIIYVEEPGRISLYKKGGSVKTDEHYGWEDTTRVNVGGLDIEVIEGDSVRVRVGNKEIVVDEDGAVDFKRTYKRKFNGHWAGFDIGLNGYINDNGTMDFAPEDEYLDLRMEKSVIVNINFFEQNFAFTRNKKFGALTGLGLSLPNYRFRRATHLSNDSSQLVGYLAEGISVRKTKLSMMYLTLPVLFEYQTNSHHRKNSFHIGFGMVVSARLMSWTKVYYNELNKDFTLNRYNTEAGAYEPELASTSPGFSKVKEKDDWFLRPFKFEPTLRVGWGIINLWVTYSFQPMFRDGKGPEVYPWSAGITLINF
jgi:hypothetical protein